MGARKRPPLKSSEIIWSIRARLVGLRGEESERERRDIDLSARVFGCFVRNTQSSMLLTP